MSSPALKQQVSKIYQEHHRWLQGWLRPRVDCRELAADLVQDVFIRVLTAEDAAARIEAVREPKSYLATIAQRLMIDHFRRARLERAWLQALAEQPEAVEVSEETRAILLETLCELDAMLAGLGPKVRQAFLLAQFDGMPYKRIAERLDLSLATVNRYIAKAMHQCLLHRLRTGL
ncbi:MULTISPECIES: sigma-70 family RNA polymerase sigma factor [Pseudomonas]|jgi:RNA polymerase sigma-70 factor (ECF subfamily)|uniref:sigma-70 family RNA polymerase sigma factor n=1 Tax=Pseudomonas TaxID=286 RepID=UPI0005B9BFD1|nr:MULTISPECIES: sigma-70 family RNA polymerase sigma factor [Pseudomonas]KRV64063.1 RNA polymerase subunit sigma [Pseudomonas citronellolis]KRW79938.1 RNA polymerase subunit sigma [Pseudomonas citronellolis]KWR79394.1 RNA polymerase subunit sigma [Pseudomonas sp. PI1]WAB91028.1 sigma-70 family RNA polymerase sigma factor [Pseudomonas citronellolis]WRT81725.1 sigma-70 family RNA polymerase sigma factor [Pseudomonas citronellolis]